MAEKNVWQKIAEIRPLIKVKKKKLGQAKYESYQLSAIYNEARKPMADIGLATKSSITAIPEIPEMFHCVLTVVNTDKPEDTAEFVMDIEKSKLMHTNEAQNCGGTKTFAEKYLFQSVFMLDDDELDPDNGENYKEQPQEKQELKETSKAQKLEGKTFINYKKELLNYFQNDYKKMVDYVKTFCGVTAPKEEHFKSTFEDLFREPEDDITIEQSAPEEPKEVERKRV